MDIHYKSCGLAHRKAISIRIMFEIYSRKSFVYSFLLWIKYATPIIEVIGGLNQAGFVSINPGNRLDYKRIKLWFGKFMSNWNLCFFSSQKFPTCFMILALLIPGSQWNNGLGWGSKMPKATYVFVYINMYYSGDDSSLRKISFHT